MIITFEIQKAHAGYVCKVLGRAKYSKTPLKVTPCSMVWGSQSQRSADLFIFQSVWGTQEL